MDGLGWVRSVFGKSAKEQFIVLHLTSYERTVMYKSELSENLLK